MCEMAQKREKYVFVRHECYFTTDTFWLKSNMCIYFWMKEFHLLRVQVEFIMEYLSAINILFEQNNSFCWGSVLIQLVSFLLKLSICFTDLLSYWPKNNN